MAFSDGFYRYFLGNDYGKTNFREENMHSSLRIVERGTYQLRVKQIAKENFGAFIQKMVQMILAVDPLICSSTPTLSLKL